MTRKTLQDRMREMMEPIDSAIQLTDDENEMLMLACAMFQRTTEIFDTILGEEKRKFLIKQISEDDKHGYK
jgi:hypothetical protein